MNTSREIERAHRFPGFFKVYLESTSSKSLKIPSAFVELLKRVIPKNLNLINSEGRCWRVNVDRIGKDKFFLREGWPEFVSDISLEDGQFLVFDYDGQKTFSFMHFGHSTCEQEGVQSLNSEVNVQHSTMNDKKNVEDDKIEEVVDESEEEDDDDDNTDEEEEDGDDDDDDEDDPEEDDEKEEMEADKENNETGHEIMEGLGYEIEAIIEEEEAERLIELNNTNSWIITKSDTSSGKELAGSNKDSSSSSEIVEFESEETIFKSGIVKRPKNPYFVTRLRMKRRNELHIPTDVMRDYKIKLVSPMMLLDQEGRKIYTKVRTWKDGRTWLTRGWKSFVKINNMTEKDRCICEFVMNGDEPSKVYLNMTVLPAGSWLPK